MKKHTLIENIKLDPHTYLVTIGTDMGQFTGAVECREEDWGHESQYFGFELAEHKAEIEYARAKKRFYDAQVKALGGFWADMMNTRTYDVDAYWVKKIRARVDEVEYKRKYWRDRVNDLREAYHIKIVNFDIANKRRG